MTADKYLETTGKKPFGPAFCNQWYWGREGPGDEDPEAEDYDMVVPPDVFDAMAGELTYPSCHAYETYEQAIAAFHDAWAEAGRETQ